MPPHFIPERPLPPLKDLRSVWGGRGGEVMTEWATAAQILLLQRRCTPPYPERPLPTPGRSRPFWRGHNGKDNDGGPDPAIGRGTMVIPDLLLGILVIRIGWVRAGRGLPVIIATRRATTVRIPLMRATTEWATEIRVPGWRPWPDVWRRFGVKRWRGS